MSPFKRIIRSLCTFAYMHKNGDFMLNQVRPFDLPASIRAINHRPELSTYAADDGWRKWSKCHINQTICSSQPAVHIRYARSVQLNLHLLQSSVWLWACKHTRCSIGSLNNHSPHTTPVANIYGLNRHPVKGDKYHWTVNELALAMGMNGKALSKLPIPSTTLIVPIRVTGIGKL